MVCAAFEHGKPFILISKLKPKLVFISVVLYLDQIRYLKFIVNVADYFRIELTVGIAIERVFVVFAVWPKTVNAPVLNWIANALVFAA